MRISVTRQRKRFRNRSQRSEGDSDSFPSKTLSEWFERFGGSSFIRGKNEPVPERSTVTEIPGNGTSRCRRKASQTV